MNHPLAEALRGYLCTAAPASSSAICRHLGISQPTFSRLAGRMQDELLAVGRTRGRRYLLRRSILDVGPSLPIYRVDEQGGAVVLGTLHGAEPGGFYWEAAPGRAPRSGWHEGLPWWLHDQRPAGYLGRQVPRRHPELGLPEDIRFWSADHCLAYLTRFGWDTAGNLIAGDAAFALRMQQPIETARADYPRLASDVLGLGAAGSSAAGEQPKFLALVEGTHVLVKFSPPLDKNPVARRQADLLVCEHLAHTTLARHGWEACSSDLLEAGSRLFLEVQRFDRVGLRGRRGVVSMLALDAQFVGRLGRWSDSATELARQRVIDPDLVRQIRRRELFGELIADADMHPGNLSFFFEDGRILGLTPAYDTLPMHYAPRQGELTSPPFEPPPPRAADAQIWHEAWRAACEFWRAAADHPLISREFRRIATAAARHVAALEHLGRLLPR